MVVHWPWKSERSSRTSPKLSDCARSIDRKMQICTKKAFCIYEMPLSSSRTTSSGRSTVWTIVAVAAKIRFFDRKSTLSESGSTLPHARPKITIFQKDFESKTNEFCSGDQSPIFRSAINVFRVCQAVGDSVREWCKFTKFDNDFV